MSPPLHPTQSRKFPPGGGIYFRRVLIVLAATAVLLVLRAASDSWLNYVMETRFGKSSGPLAEVLLCLLLVVFIILVPGLRREIPLRLRGTWLLLLAALFPAVNLAFFEAPPASVTVAGVVSQILGGFAVGINEEIFLRGFAFSRSGEATPRFTVALTAFVFGAAHLFNLTAEADPLAVAATVILAGQIGILFGIIRLATGSLFWCAVLHGTTNASFAFTRSGDAGYHTAAACVTLFSIVSGCFLLFRHPATRSPRPDLILPAHS